MMPLNRGVIGLWGGTNRTIERLRDGQITPTETEPERVDSIHIDCLYDIVASLGLGLGRSYLTIPQHPIIISRLEMSRCISLTVSSQQPGTYQW